MKGDFSRMSYHERNHYSLVLMQQGRVQLDADWNEQAMIQWFHLQKLAEDLIGEHGGPFNNCGFEIKPPSNNASELDFTIGKGRYYVKGVPCENDEPCTFTNQKDYPIPEGEGIKKQSDTKYLVYLHVWFRHLTTVQDDSIREVALNGADTATRIKTVWQVKVKALGENESLTKESNYVDFLGLLKDDIKPSREKLKVQVIPSDDKTDKPCLISPQNRYRGVENQLYRVEIHKSGGYGVATFKWSRENGSVIFPIKKKVNDKVVALEYLGREVRFGLKEGDWVEVVDDDYELQGKTEDLLKVESVDWNKMEVTLSDTPKFGMDSLKHPFLRRWDHKGEGDKSDGGALKKDDKKDESDEGALKVKAGTWIELEDGIQIQFVQKRGDNVWFRSGDWWWIPARTAIGDVEWLRDKNNNPLDQEPFDHGHRYAPLALINVDGNGNVENNPVDLRRKFKQLCE